MDVLLGEFHAWYISGDWAVYMYLRSTVHIYTYTYMYTIYTHGRLVVNGYGFVGRRLRCVHMGCEYSAHSTVVLRMYTYVGTEYQSAQVPSMYSAPRSSEMERDSLGSRPPRSLNNHPPPTNQPSNPRRRSSVYTVDIRWVGARTGIFQST